MVKSIARSVGKVTVADMAGAGASLASKAMKAYLPPGLLNSLPTLRGSGDYTVDSNTLVPGKAFDNAATVMSQASFKDKENFVNIKNRILVSEIYSGPNPGSFSAVNFPINPGMNSTFPQLATMAQNFEKYRFRGLVFEFVSMQSEYSAVGLGPVAMAMQYNSSNPPYTNLTQMQSSNYCTTTRIDRDCVYPVECADSLTNELLIRTGTSTAPINLTDLGLLTVATKLPSSFPANALVGYVYATYDLDLIMPRMSNAGFGYYHRRGVFAHPLTPYSIDVLPQSTIPNVQLGACAAFTCSNNQLAFVQANLGETYCITLVYTDSVPITAVSPNNSGYALSGCVTNAVFASNGSFTAQLGSENTAGPQVSGLSYISNAIISQTIFVTMTTDSFTPTITFTGSTIQPTGAGTITCDLIVTCIGSGLSQF